MKITGNAQRVACVPNFIHTERSQFDMTRNKGITILISLKLQLKEIFRREKKEHRANVSQSNFV